MNVVPVKDKRNWSFKTTLPINRFLDGTTEGIHKHLHFWNYDIQGLS